MSSTKKRKKPVTKKEVEKNVRAWLRALRSGKYKQTDGTLCDGKKYCCLGVACKVVYPNSSFTPDAHGYREFGTSGKFDNLPHYVNEKLGLADPRGEGKFEEAVLFRSNTLVGLNDTEGWSFKKIAAFIASQPKGLFKFKNLDIK